MPALTVDNGIHRLHIGDDENRFTTEWVAEFGAALDVVEAAEGPRALVTVASGKFFSNGLDLDGLGANPDQLIPYVDSVHGLFARLLTLPVPSIVVLQGHAYGAAAMLALAHDHRIMRSDRGYFCFPEVNISIPFTPGMAALIQAKLSPAAAHESMTTGRRYGGVAAHALGIVGAALPEDELADAAGSLASELAPTAGATLTAIRTQMYAGAIAALQPTP